MKQIRIPLCWIRAFVRGAPADLERRFTVDAHLRLGARITITTDASPFGIGGILEVNDSIVASFADRIHPTDRRILSLSDVPSSSDQQALGALAILVALREWTSHWLNRRVQLAVQTDNIAALTMVCHMQPHSESLGIIG